VRPALAVSHEAARIVDGAMRSHKTNAGGFCSIRGEPVPFYRGCHPECARKAMRSEVKRHWDLVRAEQASGAREVIGATVFRGFQRRVL